MDFNRSSLRISSTAPHAIWELRAVSTSETSFTILSSNPNRFNKVTNLSPPLFKFTLTTEFPVFEEDFKKSDLSEDSAGAILPYRSKINDVLKMIDELINGENEESINNVPMVSPYEFKNNVMNTLQEFQKNDLSDTQRNEDFTQQPQNQTFNLF